jgi:hypothetical protein
MMKPEKQFSFYLLALLLPLLILLGPVIAGYSWSSIGPNSPGLGGRQFNSLNPPEGYAGRMPDQPITIEPWGASVINVPYEVRIRQYLFEKELPLWNPYQGIGQPFAAQGEGSPYFPLTILRALVPYSKSNYVTFMGFFISSVFLFLFLTGLGISNRSAYFGGTIFMLSGALSLFIARPNIADQLCMVPVLFWAVARAVQERRAAWYAVLSMAVAINILAGFIQVAVLSVLLAGIFGSVYTWWICLEPKKILKDWTILGGIFILGIGLSAFHIFPIAEAIRVSFNKNPEQLAALPIPYANILAFFFPLLWGQFFESWVPGHYPDVVDWDNLFAYAGTGLFLLTVMGYSISNWQQRIHRNLFLFFSMGGLFLLLRYVSFPVISLLNYLPIISRQSPKHANGLTVFFFVIASVFAFEYIQVWDFSRIKKILSGLVVLIVAFVSWLISKQGGFYAIEMGKALQHVSITLILFVATIAALRLSAGWSKYSISKAQYGVLAVLTAELILYIPFGNSNSVFLWARIGLSGLVLACGMLLLNHRYLTAGLTGFVALATYISLIVLPDTGLPVQFELDEPPAYMQWLREHTGSNYRTFGIQPETSSLGAIQDIGVVGPFGLQEFHNLVRLISNEEDLRGYEISTTFTLAGYMNFELEQYTLVKPIFDWIGVRYLILDHGYFNSQQRIDHIPLLSEPELRVAYEDERVTVIESQLVKPRVFFSPYYRVFHDQESILAFFQDDPREILGPPILEKGSIPETIKDSKSGEFPLPKIATELYTANRLRFAFEAPTSGLLVIKDGFYPGWRATIDGKDTEVLRVNGMVKGVLIEELGYHVVEFEYAPQGFIIGIWLFIAIFTLFSIGVAFERFTHQEKIPSFLLFSGAVLVFLVILFAFETYYIG